MLLSSWQHVVRAGNARETSLCLLAGRKSRPRLSLMGEEPERIASKNPWSQHCKIQQIAWSTDISNLEWYWGVHINIFVFLILMVHEELRRSWNMGWVHFPFEAEELPVRGTESLLLGDNRGWRLDAVYQPAHKSWDVCPFIFHWRSLT